MPLAQIQDIELFYTTTGTGSACLVMHGGLGCDHTYLRGFDVLSDIVRLIYYDHRHNGRSGHPPLETVTHAQLADDAEALRGYLGLGPVIVLAHSYGGFIALEYALRYPHAVSRLILLDTAPSWRHTADIERNLLARNPSPEVLASLSSPITDDAGFQQVINPLNQVYFVDYQPAYEAVFAQMIVNCAVNLHQTNLLPGYDVTARLHEITCPTLLLVGRHDPLCPPVHAQQMHTLLPHAHLVVCENSGHYPWVEEPEVVFPTMRKWIQSPQDFLS